MGPFNSCPCCGGYVGSVAGCSICNCSKTYCRCGVLVGCGCGRKFAHDCTGAVVIDGTNTVPVGIVIPIGYVVPPRPTFVSIVPEGFITETGLLLN